MVPKPFQTQHAKVELSISSQKIAISLPFFCNLQAGSQTRNLGFILHSFLSFTGVLSILPPQGIQLLPPLHSVCHRAAREICLNANKIEPFSHHKQLLMSPRLRGSHSRPSAWKSLVVHQTHNSIPRQSCDYPWGNRTTSMTGSLQAALHLSSDSLYTWNILSAFRAAALFLLHFHSVHLSLHFLGCLRPLGQLVASSFPSL